MKNNKLIKFSMKTIAFLGILLSLASIAHAASGQFTSTYSITANNNGDGWLDTRNLVIRNSNPTFSVRLAPSTSNAGAVTGRLRRNGLLGWGNVGTAQSFHQTNASTRNFSWNNSGTYRIRLSVNGTSRTTSSGSVRIDWTDR